MRKIRIPYDLIGSRETGAVAVVEVPDGMDPEQVASEIMRRHKHVKSVLMKAGGREGDFRIRPLELIAGSEQTEVIHKEHGYRLKLDPRLVYFSPREASDRMMIAETVRDGERVLVMFAGIGPYAIAIARKRRVVVVGVELNTHAARYFAENVELNKLGSRVFPIEGDVAYVVPSLRWEFDRIVMPLPKGAYRFLDVALSKINKKGGIIHFYYWGDLGSLDRARDLFRSKAVSMGLEVVELMHRIISSYAPRIYKFRIDFFVNLKRIF